MAPSIFLISPISQRGHLDTYARLYSLCLLELGYHVTLIAGEDTGIAAWLAERHDGTVENFVFYTRTELARPDPFRNYPVLSRARRIYREQGVAGIYFRILKRLGLTTIDLHRTSFRPLIEEIETAQHRSGSSPSLVFFLYLDFMSELPTGRRWLERHLSAPWSGILFHPRANARSEPAMLERYFSYGKARGAALLNPYAVDLYQHQLPALVFGIVPDITDGSLSDEPIGIIQQLRTQARGRTVVTAFGTLSPQKGVLRLLEVIRGADPEKFFFLVAGEVIGDDPTAGEMEKEVNALIRNTPENCLLHLAYIPDERMLNALIAASDIVYAVYPDARDSSNSLTKAAVFEKPILVNADGLSGKRVARYRIGATTADRRNDILDALETLQLTPKSSYDFAAYRQDHSTDALKRSLSQLISAWLAP